MDFMGKVVLVTGASSGIGAETARHFSKLNGTVVLVGRNENNLNETAKDCGENALVIRADLTRDEDVRRVVDTTITSLGRLDVLLNIAGIGGLGGILSTTLEQFDEVIGINLRAVYHLTKICVPHLKLTKGCVVSLSSVASQTVIPDTLIYSIAKVGLDHLTKSLAVEVAPDGVRVNAINAGVVLTPLIASALGSRPLTVDSFVKIYEERTPLGRLGTKQEIAKAIAFLASNDTASYITGATLSVDGGLALGK